MQLYVWSTLWILEARTQVVEEVGYILVGSVFSVPPRGGWGHAPPGNFGFLDLLRSFLMQFWSNKVPENAHYT